MFMTSKMADFTICQANKLPLETFCINMSNYQKSTFHQLSDFLNPALGLLGLGLKKSLIRQKLNFANHPYLCKDLH